MAATLQIEKEEEEEEQIEGEIEVSGLRDTDLLLIDLENTQFGLFDIPYDHRKHQIFHKYICSNIVIFVCAARIDGIWSIQSDSSRGVLLDGILNKHREEISKYLDGLCKLNNIEGDGVVIVDLPGLSESGIIEKLGLKHHNDFEPLSDISSGLKEFIHTFRCGKTYIYFPGYFFKEVLKNSSNDLEVPKKVRVAYAQGMPYGEYSELTQKNQNESSTIPHNEPCGLMYIASTTNCDEVVFKYNTESDSHALENLGDIKILRIVKKWLGELNDEKKKVLENILFEHQTSVEPNNVVVYKRDKGSYRIHISLYYLVFVIDNENIDLLKTIEEQILECGKKDKLYDDEGIISLFSNYKEEIIKCLKIN